MKALLVLILFLAGCAMFTNDEGKIVIEAYPVGIEIDVEGDDFDDFIDDADDGYEEPYEVVVDLPNGDDEDSERVIEPMVVGRFAVLIKNCNVRLAPGGKKSHILNKGRRLWIETSSIDMGWATVYTKKSLAYMHRNCFTEE